jgi:hypothetical protein
MEQSILTKEQPISNEEQPVVLIEEQPVVLIEEQPVVLIEEQSINVPIKLLRTIDILTETLNEYKLKYEYLLLENTSNLNKIEEYNQILKTKDEEILELQEKINSVSKIDLLIKMRENLKNINVDIENDEGDVNNDNVTNNGDNVTNNDDNVTNNDDNVTNNDNINNKPNPIRKRPIQFRRF